MWKVKFFKTELVGGLDSRLGLLAWLSREFQLRGNWMTSLYFLSCSAPAVMTLQLLTCLAHVQLLAACKPQATCEIQSRVPISLHNSEQFFSLSYTLPLHDSHLNTGLLIAKIQANLTQNKTNKMVDKIQPYIDKKKTPTLIYVQTLNTKKVGKKIFSHISNHITFSPNLLLLLVLSHYVHLHPFHCSIFFLNHYFQFTIHNTFLVV